MARRKKLLLVWPRMGAATNEFDRLSHFLNKRAAFLPVSLATVAALTPREWDVRIVDENVQRIDYDEPVDLVGVSGLITQGLHGLRIAREFTRRGVPVVWGGPAVSLAPERFRDHADVLILGEAERVWPRFLEDFLRGKHEREYRETERIDLSSPPMPDYSSIPRDVVDQYFGGIVQCSRGCPYDCEFCSVPRFGGRRMRYKPIPAIMREIEQLHRMGLTTILLADDNLTAKRSYARDLLREIRDWNRKQKVPASFATQVSIDIAEDETLLELAAEAGLTRLVIGIETPNPDSLEETNKRQNLEADLLANIRRIHEHGIIVRSVCMVGFDHDDLSIFRQQRDFIMQAGIPAVQVFPLQAVDGSKLKDRIIAEGRYVDIMDAIQEDPEHADASNTFTMIPKNMSIDQLRQGMAWLRWQLYDTEPFLHRLRTFFENYERSPKKGRLRIPARPVDLQMAWRVGRYILSEASRADRKALRTMLGFARRSSHPQRYMMAITNFLALLHFQARERREHPDPAAIPYPT